MPTDHRLLDQYNRELKRKPIPFPCPLCQTLVLPRDYERHCHSHHGLNPKLCCVWCSGNLKWKSGKKNLFARHLLACFRKFMASFSPENSPRLKLQDYRKLLKTHRDSFSCPLCSSLVFPKDFEKHCSENHGLNPKLCCVWCLGKEIWEAGEKERHADHLVFCFRKFNLSRPSFRIRVPEEPRLLNVNPMCEPLQFFDRENLKESLPECAFVQFQILDDGSEVSYYRLENLNAAASYARLFSKNGDSSDWIHVMVRATAFESFYEAVSNDGENTKLLPFSCWCDGGNEKEALHRQHRHAIVVCSPRNRFVSRVWNKVRSPDRPRRGFKVKVMQYIRKPLHLVNAMGYVSGRKSSCKFDKIDFDDMKKRVSGGENHFYIFRSLPVDFLLPLAVQWKGGLEQALKQTKFQNVSVARLMKSRTLLFRKGKWTQKIGDFYGFESGLVLPLEKSYRATEDPGPESCHLTGDRRLYFERAGGEDDETWLRRQAEGGNCFFENVAEEFWIPRPRDQVKLNLAMPLLSKVEDLKATVEEKNEEIESLKRKHEEETVCLKRRHEEAIVCLEKENERLNRKREEETICFKKENERLKREIDRLRSERRLLSITNVTTQNYY